jgi:hypothetical protein
VAWRSVENVIGDPISHVIVRAISGSRARKPEMIRLRYSSRCSTLTCEYAAKAARAATTARSTSSAVPRLIVANVSSVAGSRTPKVRGAAGSTHAPPM